MGKELRPDHVETETSLSQSLILSYDYYVQKIQMVSAMDHLRNDPLCYSILESIPPPAGRHCVAEMWWDCSIWGMWDGKFNDAWPCEERALILPWLKVGVGP